MRSSDSALMRSDSVLDATTRSADFAFACAMISSASDWAVPVIFSAEALASSRIDLVCSSTRSTAWRTAACGDRVTSSSAITRFTFRT